MTELHVTRFSLLQCPELNLVLCLATSDKRFGFSVVGGVDEGLPPRVDDIQPGKHRLLL